MKTIVPNCLNRSAMPEKQRAVIIWLSVLALMIVLMVIIGGITRLSHSGLSIVDWRPLMGIIPPLGDAEWNRVFDLYKQYPEFKQLNHGMSLPEFKSIFFWEYFHRLFGRLIGLVFLFPWLWFNFKRKFTIEQNLRLLVLFFLGGMQGILGWYMVQSGLVNDPHVSHYRLAAHLVLALALFGGAVYMIFNLRRGEPVGKSAVDQRLRRLALTITALIAIQIFYGALVAGLKAGLSYNSFPTMNGTIIPPGLFILEPTWTNLFDNHTTVQFIHRMFGWLILLSTATLWFFSRNRTLPRFRVSVRRVVIVVAIQFTLGVITLVNGVPLVPAVLHQAFALILLVAAINLNHCWRRGEEMTARVDME